MRFCVPVFFMISGALFLDPTRNVTWSSLFRKSLPRLITAFLFWSLFFGALGVFGPGGDGSLRTLLERVVIGHYHLWFLFALVGLYLVTPILRRVVTDRHTAWYFVALAVLFATVLPLLTHVPLLGDAISAVLDTMKLQLVLGYSLYFVLGYLLSTLTLSRRSLSLLAIGGILAVAVTATGTSFLSNRGDEPNALLYGYLTPNVVLSAIAVFCLVKAWGDRRALSRRLSPVVTFLSTYAFGIYLVHPLFQWGFQELGITTAMAPPLLSVPALTLMILIPSALVAVAIHHIPRVGRYIS